MTKRQKTIILVAALVVIAGSLSLGLIKYGAKKYKEQKITNPEAKTQEATKENFYDDSWTTTTLREGETLSLSAVKYTELPKDLLSQGVKWQQPEKIGDLGMLIKNSKSQASVAYLEIAKFKHNETDGKIIIARVVAGMFPAEYLFINFNSKYILIQKHSEPLTEDDWINKNKFLVDKNFEIFTYPKEIMIPGKEELKFVAESSLLYDYGGYGEYVFHNNFPTYGETFKKPFIKYGNFELYMDNDGSLVYVSESVKPIIYEIIFPEQFIFTTGENVKTENYDHTHSECVGIGLNMLTENTMNNLDKIGVSDTGNPIFKFKNEVNNEEIKSILDNYNSYNETMQSGVKKLSIEEFIADKPVIIMQDKFGRLIEYKKEKYNVSLAECGKPVIYLYPEKETKVQVQVKPNGGFTLTDPFYPSTGWLVNAKPNGELSNISDGKNYPYLFWEGKAVDMKVPSEGFVLKKENIGRDMKILLKKLGLNEKETADFLEFWQEKLEIKPYVFVTFVSQDEFDRVAPLNVSPRPDKTIRVFMDYQPLDNPVSVRPLKITTPTREGFTVIEWGGRLHQ
jgi:hypothetical protein